METYDLLDALGDPTRRRVFELLRDGPLPVQRIAEQLPVSRPAVSQHLRVLSEAGLVTFRRVTYDLDKTIQKIYDTPELDNFLGDRLREGR